MLFALLLLIDEGVNLKGLKLSSARFDTCGEDDHPGPGGTCDQTEESHRHITCVRWHVLNTAVAAVFEAHITPGVGAGHFTVTFTRARDQSFTLKE